MRTLALNPMVKAFIVCCGLVAILVVENHVISACVPRHPTKPPNYLVVTRAIVLADNGRATTNLTWHTHEWPEIVGSSYQFTDENGFKVAAPVGFTFIQEEGIKETK